MGLYRCLWPNGEVSFVVAKDESDAILHLDEFGEADEEMLSEVEDGDFMVTFAASRDEVDEKTGEREYDWVLSETGERTTDEDGPLDWDLAKECWAAKESWAASADDDDDDDDEEEGDDGEEGSES
jgi:hypothetical protein